MSYFTEELDPEVEALLDELAAEDLLEITDEEIQEHADTFAE